MMKKIRINNGFNNLPTMNGVVLTCCTLEGKVEVGDKIIVNQNIELTISKIETFNSGDDDIAVTIYKKDLNKLSGIKMGSVI